MALCLFNRLADCLGNFGSLSLAAAYMAIAIPYDNQRAEAHISAAFDSLCDTVNGNKPFL